jgi:hypothetical protein
LGLTVKPVRPDAAGWGTGIGEAHVSGIAGAKLSGSTLTISSTWKGAKK